MTTTTARPRRGRVIGTLAAVGLLVLAALGTATFVGSSPRLGVNLPGSQRASKALTASRMAPAVLKVTPTNRATAVRPDAPVTVRVASGTLRAVALMDSSGHRVEGQTAADGGTWSNSELLHPSTTYTLSVAAIGSNGAPRSVSSSFRTLNPRVDATYSVLPADNVVGVGMPVIVLFDSAVTTKARRAEVEKRVEVTSVPFQPGSWGWLDERQLMWRPRSYWTPGTRVTVSTRLHGVETGDGKWVTADSGAHFAVGPSMISTVDMNKHTLTLRRGGVVIRTFPVSTGRPGPKTETRTGIKVVMERAQTVVMDSATIGIPAGSPGAYRITTKWNLRVTWTGEYIHAAPWSVDSQGNTNVSHGCTNMSPENARWMFENSKVGDVVAYTGSSRTFEPLDGYGVWAYTYASWAARSALPPLEKGKDRRI